MMDNPEYIVSNSTLVNTVVWTLHTVSVCILPLHAEVIVVLVDFFLGDFTRDLAKLILYMVTIIPMHVLRHIIANVLPLMGCVLVVVIFVLMRAVWRKLCKIKTKAQKAE